RYCATAPRKIFGAENLGACGLRSRRSQIKPRFSCFDFLRKKNDGRPARRLGSHSRSSKNATSENWVPNLASSALDAADTRPPDEAANSRRACIEQVRAQLHVSERRACAALGQHRSTQRKVPRGREDEERLTADIIELARQYGRYGYRKVAELLRQAGWIINDKRVERIWQREGLKVPHK